VTGPDAPTPSNSIRARLPNALTIGRILLAVVFFILLSLRAGTPEGPDPWLIAAAILFIAAAATDALDGILARRWNVVSPFGRVMDPFADKVLVVGAFIFLAGPGFLWETPDNPAYQASGVYPWMTVVILARELLVTSLRGVLEGRGVNFQATSSGKWKMILQSAAVPIVLFTLALHPAEPGTGVRIGLDILAWVVVAVTIWSGVPYIVRGVAAFREPA
jgi:CDP-diacylglycerol---glycerol-3-phosphate 3-phosphatidyltransferase